MTVVLGIGFTHHESSVALAVDGVLDVALALERVTRRKRDYLVPERPGLLDELTTTVRRASSTSERVDLVVASHIEHIAASELRRRVTLELPWLDLPPSRVLVLPHHFAHACSAFYPSGFDDAAVYVADGAGGPVDEIARECSGPEAVRLKRAAGEEVVPIGSEPDGMSRRHESESFYRFRFGLGWKLLGKTAGDWAGLGAAYGEASQALFGSTLEGGKTMGLAPFGKPRPGPWFLQRGVGRGELPVFERWHTERSAAWTRRVRDLVDAGLLMDTDVTDFAATVQAELENAALAQVRWLRAATSAPKLCMAGGVALNVVSNSRIAEQSGFSEVYVPSAPGDDGIAVGCALYGAALTSDLAGRANRSPYLGPTPERAREAAAGARDHRAADVARRCAALLAAGRIVGVHRGRSEFGPRALGNRSILADPRLGSTKQYLNDVVKGREDFRPFAPVVMAEYVRDHFETAPDSRYMSFVADVRPVDRSKLAAVTHLDGSARVQVLSKEDNEFLWTILDEFRELTGLPVLLNTSFNRAGEPLVESEDDAWSCARRARLDYLVVRGQLHKVQPAGSSHAE